MFVGNRAFALNRHIHSLFCKRKEFCSFKTHPRIQFFSIIVNFGITKLTLMSIINTDMYASPFHVLKIDSRISIKYQFILVAILLALDLRLIVRRDAESLGAAGRKALYYFNNRIFDIQNSFCKGEISEEEGQRQKADVRKDIDCTVYLSKVVVFLVEVTRCTSLLSILNLGGGVLIGFYMNKMPLRNALCAYTPLFCLDAYVMCIPQIIVELAIVFNSEQYEHYTYDTGIKIPQRIMDFVSSHK